MNTIEKIRALIAAVLASHATWSENGWECSIGTDPSDPDRDPYLDLCGRQVAKRELLILRLEHRLASEEAALDAYAEEFHRGDGVEYWAHEGYFEGHAEGVEHENGPFG